MKMTYRGFTTEPIFDLEDERVRGTAERNDVRLDWDWPHEIMIEKAAYCAGRAFKRVVDEWLEEDGADE